jgi:Protein of unknown function (DUF2958)
MAAGSGRKGYVMTTETPSEHALKLLTVAQYHRVLANGRWNAAHVAKDGNTDDLAPVVKLFCPWGGATWLLTELDPEDPDIAFGLCDLGMGSPELGSVRLSELATMRGPGGLGIERDRNFHPTKRPRAYADEARQRGYIVA